MGRLPISYRRSRAVTVHQIPNTLDLQAFWMPFTANRQFKETPRLFASAEGMYYTSVDGRKVIDASAGLWCVNAGHGRREIAAAVERQLMNLDFAPSFSMGHPIAFDFARRLAEIAPKGLDRVFFTNSGSESVDTALKIALAYHRATGQPTRTRLIGRERGYHGVGFGGMSVGGMVNNRRAFATHLPGVDHIAHTHDLARNAFSDRKSTRLNSSHLGISYSVFCLKKKKNYRKGRRSGLTAPINIQAQRATRPLRRGRKTRTQAGRRYPWSVLAHRARCLNR